MDSNLLLEAAEFAAMNSSQCVIVARHGRIVGEWYWNGTGPNTPVKSWSVAKSYASTVAGIAISRGDIESVNDPVADYVPEWQGTDKESVTIRHLLSMSSGLEFNLLADNVGISLAKDMTKKALENPLVNPPGALWEYNNHTVQMIEPVLRAATGMAPDEYAAEHMFVPMGMNASWKRDKQEQPAMYMNVHASCRDHLKFGYLFLRNGCWDGDQLIDESFVKEATTPSTQMNRGYGYWWWLNGEMPTLSSIDFEPKTTVLQPGVPSDAYCALGLGNQIVEVIPSLDMVIVRFGPAPHENLDLWAVQDGAVMDALMNDDVQEISYGVVQRVVQAVVTE
jgi:CubicO group peptidase (beta-lactamase class C family)